MQAEALPVLYWVGVLEQLYARVEAAGWSEAVLRRDDVAAVYLFERNSREVRRRALARRRDLHRRAVYLERADFRDVARGQYLDLVAFVYLAVYRRSRNDRAEA